MDTADLVIDQIGPIAFDQLNIQIGLTTINALLCTRKFYCAVADSYDRNIGCPRICAAFFNQGNPDL